MSNDDNMCGAFNASANIDFGFGHRSNSCTCRGLVDSNDCICYWKTRLILFEIFSSFLDIIGYG